MSENQTKKLTKGDLYRMYARSTFLLGSFNFERMQSMGFCVTMMPAIKRLYSTKEERAAALKRHLEFFNTHPFLVTFISGLVVSMEEAKENISTIRAIKVSTMGPGGGIGDAVFWLTLLSICGGVGASFSLSGSWLGPIFFLVAFNVVHFALRFGLANYGYKIGVSAIANLKEQTRKISHAASIVGLTVIGAMTASYVRLESGLQLVRHVEGVEKPFVYSLQKDLIDPIMPKLLPLLWTLFILWRIKKGTSTLKLVVWTIIFGLVCIGLPVLVKHWFGVDIIDPEVLAARMSQG